MKKGFKVLLYFSIPFFAASQSSVADSMKRQLTIADNDSVRYEINDWLFNHYLEFNKDSALTYIENCLLIAREKKKKLSEATCLDNKGTLLRHLGRYPESLQCYLDAFEIASDPESEKSIWILPPWMLSEDRRPQITRKIVLGNLHMGIANLFERIGNNELVKRHLFEAVKIGEETKGYSFLFYLYASMGQIYKNFNDLDSALLLEQKAFSIATQFGYKDFVSRVLAFIGDIYLSKGEIGVARKYFHEGLNLAYEENDLSSMVTIYFGLSESFIAEGEKDSSLYYAREAKKNLDKLGSLSGTDWNPATAYENLYKAHKLRNEVDSAYKYIDLAVLAKDSLSNHRLKSSAQFQNLFLEEQIRLREMEKDKIQFQNRVRTYSLLAGIVVLLLLAIVFYRSNRQKQKAKLRIEKAYDELKATQSQLVQREKMASLGELTAGIAHEIQNPLNFVNNFSDVNKELTDELEGELDKGNYADAKALAKDIKNNEEKINHHGKRADSIVKSMLQHSRISSGKREPTDINALADEYLRLAYHGFRAKDKSFNAKTETHFDPSIGKINVVPQEIGRVILNLINNAFYAVNEKQKQNFSGYEPTVTVSTAKRNGKVEIKVIDNGNGIPQKALDKIFQPFFTTKPTGQGTGLGLSLSYDIVKAHGGELKVETRENVGSEFTVELPL